MTYGNRLVQHEYIHMREKTHLKFIQILGKKNMKQLLIVSCNHCRHAEITTGQQNEYILLRLCKRDTV